MTPPVTIHSRYWNYWARNFLAVESSIAVLTGTLFSVWVTWFAGSRAISTALGQNWSGFFSTLVTLFGALFGFVVTAASISVALTTDAKMRPLVLVEKYDQLWDTFLLCMVALGLSIVVALVGLVSAGVQSVHAPVVCALSFVGFLSFIGLARVIWLLNSLPRVHASLVKHSVG